ncbi:nitrophenyl compound nitroreductase subunit ArsF family protein [Flavobacterium sp. ZT3R18]|uniref:nitrophenyl compound nitroreductase subunit ArsF family protein n=1 Tax=Flavobacterium sp. ZT3R18 TaxID=2594429 RepID=UPI001C8F2AEC|nr:nitrophenyl compound nitroreductase subunit ArsF family protein [Flavobacterium sp. ZT3R18]
MKRNILTSVFATLMLLLVSYNGNAQTKKATVANTKATIEIIQFHSEHRCMTCNKIEVLTRETLKSYPSIPFSLVNVDDKKNEKLAAQFEAAGTALFLYNPKTKKKQDLSDMAFMNAGDKDKFIKELKIKIESFK